MPPPLYQLVDDAELTPLPVAKLEEVDSEKERNTQELNCQRSEIEIDIERTPCSPDYMHRDYGIREKGLQVHEWEAKQFQRAWQEYCKDWEAWLLSTRPNRRSRVEYRLREFAADWMSRLFSIKDLEHEGKCYKLARSAHEAVGRGDKCRLHKTATCFRVIYTPLDREEKAVFDIMPARRRCL